MDRVEHNAYKQLSDDGEWIIKFDPRERGFNGFISWKTIRGALDETDAQMIVDLLNARESLRGGHG